MDKDLKQLISETITETFAKAPEKLIERGVREIQYDICPHCKKEIHERHEYTEDGGLTWRHSECKGLIARPETPDENVAEWLRPYVKEAREERKAARKALGMKEMVERGFAPEDQTQQNDPSIPPSGEVKYSKQEPGGTMSAVNIEEAGSQEESKRIHSQAHADFMNGAVKVVNTTQIPIEIFISEFSSNVNGVEANAYIVHIQDAGRS